LVAKAGKSPKRSAASRKRIASVLAEIRLMPVDRLRLAWRRRLWFPEDNSGLTEIVGRNFHAYSVARNDSDEVLAHLTGDMSEHDVPIG
jgi:hypothetical protein